MQNSRLQILRSLRAQLRRAQAHGSFVPCDKKGHKLESIDFQLLLLETKH